MKLLAYGRPGSDRSGTRLGLQTDAGIRDLTATLGASDVGEMLRHGIGLDELRDRAVHAELVTGDVVPRAPIARPGKIICVGLNYHDHCREQSIEPPTYPMLFSKFANAVADPGAAVTRPRATEQLDLECELGVVIGRRASRIGRDEAGGVIFGYTIVNDVTMRDLQKEDRQWLRAKGSDGFAPMGPVVVSADELGDPGSVRLRSSVNGETWQDSSTAEMVFDVRTIVAFASRTITLEPGDVIATGTPAGVGHDQSPPRYLADGDVMRCEIEGIGVIENRVVDETPRSSDHRAAAGVDELFVPG
ncbi:MAG TPA: fumarylacetoacetate hydrolase family protein [Candidatus Limnocylindria bacterium]|nr:fumarylacetoacetate hydrolase family protein [Candidatus Limnocylindria bacterium]